MNPNANADSGDRVGHSHVRPRRLSRRARPGSSARRIRFNFHFMAYGDLRVAAASYDNGNQRQESSRPSPPASTSTWTSPSPPPSASTPSCGRSTRTARSRATSQRRRRRQVHPTNSTSTSTPFSSKATSDRSPRACRTDAAKFDLPIAFGRIPLVHAERRLDRGCFRWRGLQLSPPRTSRRSTSATPTSPSSPAWAQLTTDADPNASRNRVFGLAGFADAKKGYIEYGYGYVNAETTT